MILLTDGGHLTNADDVREEMQQLDELAALAEITRGGLPSNVSAEIVDEFNARLIYCHVPYERAGLVYPERCELPTAHHIAGHDDRDHYAGNIGWWRRA